MNPTSFLAGLSFLWSPWTVTIMVAAAFLMVWMSVAPAPKRPNRMQEYTDDPLDELDNRELEKPFLKRTVLPLLAKLLRLLGSIAPKRNIEKTREKLQAAGGVGGLRPLDFIGMRVLSLALLGGGAVLLFAPTGASPLILMRNTAIAAAVGFFLPLLWLESKIAKRKHDILRALPDALDMLTIGVEAGLAFEMALLRVGEKWKNALTLEFRRAVGEMRMGIPRAMALKRMAERTGVHEVSTFVAVLVQSDSLGVSISEVLHTQAAAMRVWRRQRVQELAQQASTKMVFPLVFLVLPSMFIVILGPSVPLIISTLSGMG
ncbi:MAG: type II secretion system F family protein [Anaerolineae bacterium]